MSQSTSKNDLPPPSSPMFTETLINKICCGIINRLLGALHCFSPPVGELHELDDGVVLVELIESFEEAIFVRYPQLMNSQQNSQNPQQKPFRNALSRTGSRSNMEYVEQWLLLEGVNLDPKRSIREIFAEIRRSSQELVTFLGTFSENDLTDGSSLATMLQKQRVAIYARSIAYISALCYAIFTIFLKHDEQFRKLIPGYRFTVEPDELLHILFYTKWKLTEEELLIKDLEFMRLKDSADLLEIENRRLKGLKRGDKRSSETSQQNSEPSYQENSPGQTPYPQHHQHQQMNFTSTSTSQNSPQPSSFRNLKNFKQTSELQDFESVSSITISSVAELRSVATQTDIFGLENELHVQYGFNRKLMEMTVQKDREIAEKVAEQVRAAKAAAEEQRRADARWAAEQEAKKKQKEILEKAQKDAQKLSQHSNLNSQTPNFENRASSTLQSNSRPSSDLPTPEDPSYFPVHYNQEEQQQNYQQQRYNQQQLQHYHQQQQQQQNYQQQQNFRNLQNQNYRPQLPPNYQQAREMSPRTVLSPPLSPDDNVSRSNNNRGHHHHQHQHSNSSNNSNSNNFSNTTSPPSSVQLRHPRQQTPAPHHLERPSSLTSSTSSNSQTPKRNSSSNLNRNSSHVHSSIYSRGQFDVLEAQQGLAGGPLNSTKNQQTSISSSNEAIQLTPIDFEYNKQQVELSLTGKGGSGKNGSGGRQSKPPSPRPSEPPPAVPTSSLPNEDQRDYTDNNSQTSKNTRKTAENIPTNNSNKDQRADHHHQLPPIDGDNNPGDLQTEKLRQLEMLKEHHHRSSSRGGYTDDEQLRNRILIARLLAELSYEKNKNLRQTTQDYI